MAHWWQTACFYQIYPRSFQDASGDGVGDLPGITQRLDYLSWLGVDALWVSPFFPSPMADFGYDVTDHCGVDPLFGTLEDFDELLRQAHRRGLKLVIDFVPNHTSDRHPWFLDSRSSRESKRRDWYTWRDARENGQPPNNWLSIFDAKSAWQCDQFTGQFYLHSFLKEQPDLNWRNPNVRAAMFEVMRFWLRRGVDGFRVDVPYRCLKDELLRDNPVDPDWRPGMNPAFRLIERYNKNLPEIHEFNRWLRKVVDEFEERVLIGKMYLPCEDLVAHYGEGDEYHLPFNFALIAAPWDPAAIRGIVERYEACLAPEAWPNWVLGNHDRHRAVSRFGKENAAAAMMMLLTLRGTPTIYYGDELGMTDGIIPAQLVQDPWEKFLPGFGFGRDPVRTPMQWSPEPHAGFAPPTSKPWLPVNNDVMSVNVVSQQQQEGSVLRFTRELLKLRKDRRELQLGSYRSLPSADGVLAFERCHEAMKSTVTINFTARPITCTLSRRSSILLSTRHENTGRPLDRSIELAPHEGAVLTDRTP